MNNKQQKWLLIGLIVVALNAAVWFLGIVPARTTLGEVRNEIEVAQEKESQLLQRLQVLESIDTEVLEEEQREQEVMVPHAGLLREMMTELEAKAGEIGPVLQSMNFTAPIQVEEFQSMGINLAMEGSYAELFSYLQYLELHNRMIFVSSFSFSGEDILGATIELVMFADDFDTYTPHQAPGRSNPFSEQ